jgi:hypothetical protein
MAERLHQRLYLDFLLPSRLDDYRQLIERAATLGYGFHTVGSFHAARQAGTLEPRVLVLRCDVDTDPATAEAKFHIVEETGGRASFFFRLRTLDVDLMRRMEASGCEASYHFEEVATVAKELGLRTRLEVEHQLPLIEQRFCANVLSVRARTGLAIEVLAAHGDWINRRLGITNRRVLTPDVRRRLGIVVEAYDRDARAGITSRFADASYPGLWAPQPPSAALERGDPAVYVLTHPRQWGRNVKVNLVDDVRRLREELQHRLGTST